MVQVEQVEQSDQVVQIVQVVVYVAPKRFIARVHLRRLVSHTTRFKSDSDSREAAPAPLHAVCARVRRAPTETDARRGCVRREVGAREEGGAQEEPTLPDPTSPDLTPPCPTPPDPTPPGVQSEDPNPELRACMKAAAGCDWHQPPHVCPG